MLEQGIVLVSLKYLVFQVSETDGASLTFCLSLAVEFAASEKKKRQSGGKGVLLFQDLIDPRESNGY